MVLSNEVHPLVLQTTSSDEGGAFFVIDVPTVRKKVAQWRRALPRIKPFFAVKSNPDLNILSALAELGIGADVASLPEITAAQSAGFPIEDMIFANPVKPLAQFRAAAQLGVRRVTFDSLDELDKAAAVAPDVELLLRLAVDDSTARCQLGAKYGASLEDVVPLLRHGTDLGLNITGIAFHVGSHTQNPEAYTKAVAEAKAAFDLAAQLGVHFKVLDVGGGFVADSFEITAAGLSKALDATFGMDSGLEFIAEPGRFLVSQCATLVTQVIGKRVKDGMVQLTVDDGLYGSFNSIMYDGASPTPELPKGVGNAPMVPTSIWGPTCDGLDNIVKKTSLPASLKSGDWLVWRDMGAYTSAAGSTFNGISPPRRVYNFVSSLDLSTTSCATTCFASRVKNAESKLTTSRTAF